MVLSRGVMQQQSTGILMLPRDIRSLAGSKDFLKKIRGKLIFMLNTLWLYIIESLLARVLFFSDFLISLTQIHFLSCYNVVQLPNLNRGAPGN